jgi:hypothetical protein
MDMKLKEEFLVRWKKYFGRAVKQGRAYLRFGRGRDAVPADSAIKKRKK